jgi:two-component system CheB/CheR fusion protein
MEHHAKPSPLLEDGKPETAQHINGLAGLFDRTYQSKFLIACVGASAGGLEAYKELLSKLPPHTGISFVFVPHLAPDHDSLMVQLLSRSTVLPVTQIEEAEKAEPDHIYVIPPNKYASIKDGVLHLSEFRILAGTRTALDGFLISLAEDQRENAVCIILSGTDSYGTPGLKVLKDHGGTVFAQDPHTAKFPSMPENAIATGLVDYVLPAAEMGEALLNTVLMRSTGLPKVPSDEFQPEILASVIGILKQGVNLDFNGYRRHMLTRRILRRMQLAQISEPQRYIAHLREHPDEVARLAKDVMVSVTKFFREPDGAFEQLEKRVIPEIVNNISDGKTVRCWVAGCATGQEAYSIAMLFLEHFATIEKTCHLTILASDVDEAALSFARRGIYPENSLGGISPERLARFFIPLDDHFYKVHPKVRETVTFALHNLLSDPPFSALDLISCRNVLIYLEPELQEQIIPQLHFALNPQGFLMLGTAESVAGHRSLFMPTLESRHVYKRIGDTPAHLQYPTISGRPSAQAALQKQRLGDSPRPKELMHRLLAKRYLRAAVLTDGKGEILQYHGPTALYLDLPSGGPVPNVLAMARGGLRGKLSAAMKQAIKDRRSTEISAIVQRDEHYATVRSSISFEQVPGQAEPFLLISFDDEKSSEAAQSTLALVSPEDRSLVGQLESELKGTREELEGMIEAVQSSVENSRSSSEEAMSMNEELQSANEELESSKEEMHSLNEELVSANHQLRGKVEQLEVLNDDMANLLRSTSPATLCLDLELRIQWFTPGVTALLHLLPPDVNRPMADIAHKSVDPSLMDDAAVVLKSLLTMKKALPLPDGQLWARQIVPYRTKAEVIKGVVITYMNVTEIQLAEQRFRRLTAVLMDSSDAIIAFDFLGAITAWNRGAERMYGYTEEDALKLNIVSISPKGFRNRELRLLAMARVGNLTIPRAITRLCKDGTLRESWVTTTTLLDQDGVARSVAATERDLTDSNAVSRIQHLATHDHLTGLPNRLLLDPLATQAFAFADRTRTKVALLFIDIDDFKTVNDSRGHQFGDQVLEQIGKCLKKCMRGQDFVVRHGGDEFIVMLTGLADSKTAGKAAEHILASVGRPYKVQTEKLKSSVSIGLSLYPDDAIDLEALVRNADAAMYQAKTQGAGGYRFFTPDMAVDFWDPHSLEYGLTRALERQEFILEYQPQVDVLSGEIVGAEALVRWQHPELGLLKPSNFIAAAENSGLIVALGEWVLKTACSQLEDWKQAGFSEIRLCINLSAVQIAQIDFTARVAHILADCKADPAHLEFEITESAVMHNIDACIVRLQQIRQLGIGLALDDFGTGYSSLSYLRQLPINRLKIDISFVRTLTSAVGGDVMVNAISSMARSLGIEVLAEGVETREQLDLLKLQGCQQMQGYYFSPAVSAKEFEVLRRDGFVLHERESPPDEKAAAAKA